jgi:membrane-bound metal-dependent hydrolase YbcI (DUF457 family)
MMGKTHCVSGLAAGLAAAPLVGLQGAAEVLPFAFTTAGYALAPDLDHPGATASRLLGPVTGLLSRGVRAVSAALYRATKGRRDEDSDGEHRHASHTLVASLLFGGLAAMGGHLGGPYVVVAVLAFGLLLTASALGDWVWFAAAGIVAAWLLAAGGNPLGALSQMAVSVGVAVAVGCFAHCLGDALTLSGCPFLWPLLIRGETWYEIRPPRALRFRTGGAVERWAVMPLLMVACAVLAWPLIPGVA